MIVRFGKTAGSFVCDYASNSGQRMAASIDRSDSDERRPISVQAIVHRHADRDRAAARRGWHRARSLYGRNRLLIDDGGTGTRDEPRRDHPPAAVEREGDRGSAGIAAAACGLGIALVALDMSIELASPVGGTRACGGCRLGSRLRPFCGLLCPFV